MSAWKVGLIKQICHGVFFDNITGLVDKDNAVEIIYLYFPDGFDLVTYDT